MRVACVVLQDAAFFNSVHLNIFICFDPPYFGGEYSLYQRCEVCLCLVSPELKIISFEVILDGIIYVSSGNELDLLCALNFRLCTLYGISHLILAFFKIKYKHEPYYRKMLSCLKPFALL